MSKNMTKSILPQAQIAFGILKKKHPVPVHLKYPSAR